MAIRNIGRAEFICRLSPHGDLEHFIGKEVEWFSTKTGNIIGTIPLGDRNRGWNYIILTRNRTGKLHVCNVVCDFYSHAAARVDCMFAMVGAGQSRRAQFPRMACGQSGPRRGGSPSSPKESAPALANVTDSARIRDRLTASPN